MDVCQNSVNLLIDCQQINCIWRNVFGIFLHFSNNGLVSWEYSVRTVQCQLVCKLTITFVNWMSGDGWIVILNDV